MTFNPMIDTRSCEPAAKTGPVSTMKPARMALLLVALLSSGCASYNRDHFTVGSVPDDYRTRHPIIVTESERAVDLVVTSDAHALSTRDTNVVKAMGHRFRVSGAKSIAIIIPSGSRNEAAARRLAHDTVGVLQGTGVSAASIVIQHYDASGHGDSAALRLAYSDLVAGVDSQCGTWNEDILETTENRNYENFGCATQNNLAQMIANPADLLGPQGETPLDSERRTNVIKNWRTNGNN